MSEARTYTPQEAYEEDCRRKPTYDNGDPRVSWADLPQWAKWSWERSPSPRDWGTKKPPE